MAIVRDNIVVSIGGAKLIARETAVYIFNIDAEESIEIVSRLQMVLVDERVVGLATVALDSALAVLCESFERRLQHLSSELKALLKNEKVMINKIGISAQVRFYLIIRCSKRCI